MALEKDSNGDVLLYEKYTEQLIHTFVTKLDYCNSLLYRIPDVR